MNKDKLMLWPTPNNPEPLTGMFAVTFGKGMLERALYVSNTKGIYRVYIDGALVDQPSAEWTYAYGWIYSRNKDCIPMLIGRRITKAEYEKILRLQLADTNKGALAQPVNHNTNRVQF